MGILHELLAPHEIHLCLNICFKAIGTINKGIQSTHPNLVVVDGCKMISDLKLVPLRCRDKFPNFWVEVFQEASELDMHEARSSGCSFIIRNSSLQYFCIEAATASFFY